MMVFFMTTIMVTLLTYHPVVLGLSFVTAVITLALYGGISQTFKTLSWLCPMMILIVILNTAFNQRGATVLFTWGQRAFTRESLYFGLCLAVMLAAIMLWFSLYQMLMTTDRFLYLFAPIAPTLALSITMVLRWVPLTKYRWQQIDAARRGISINTVGAHSDFCTVLHFGECKSAPDNGTRCDNGRIGMRPYEKLGNPLRSSLRSLSALMSWSIEDAIEAADSMQARNYCLLEPKKRSSFRSYRFTAHDRISLAYLLTCALTGIGSLMVTTRKLSFFPTIQGVGAVNPLILVLIAAGMIYPLVLEGKEQLQWFIRSRLTI